MSIYSGLFPEIPSSLAPKLSGFMDICCWQALCHEGCISYAHGVQARMMHPTPWPVRHLGCISYTGSPDGCGKTGHIRPNCPNEKQRVAAARIEEVEDDGDANNNVSPANDADQNEDAADHHYPDDDDEDLYEPRADYDSQGQPDYQFDEEDYEQVSNVDAYNTYAIRDYGYEDRRSTYGVDSEDQVILCNAAAAPKVDKTAEPVYDHRMRTRERPRPPRSVGMAKTISVFLDVGGTLAHCLLDSGCEGVIISSDFIRGTHIKKFELDKPVQLQLACQGSKSMIQYGSNAMITIGNQTVEEYFDIANVDYYNVILGTPFLRRFKLILDFSGPGCIRMGNITIPNGYGAITPDEADAAMDKAASRLDKPL